MAVDLKGDVFAIARWTGVRTKAVEERLGNPDTFLSADEMSAQLSQRLSDRLKNLLAEAEASHIATARRHLSRRQYLVQDQRVSRSALEKEQADRRDAETALRLARFPKGLKGIWSRVTGGHRQIRLLNEAETRESMTRDRIEGQRLIDQHLIARMALQNEIRLDRAREAALLRRTHRDIADTLFGTRRQKEPSVHPSIERRRSRRFSD